MARRGGSAGLSPIFSSPDDERRAHEAAARRVAGVTLRDREVRPSRLLDAARRRGHGFLRRVRAAAGELPSRSDSHRHAGQVAAADARGGRAITGERARATRSRGLRVLGRRPEARRRG
jgi:hypothetical protein